ncbi:XRE family transcriptional regulator [Streptomyces sp. DW26H14]|uniref:XRE family transcriptional regulator n=1 Tax=Streptomyces sp. DW26H14 TaxID=3435395 RepID=UPI00403D6D81
MRRRRFLAATAAAALPASTSFQPADGSVLGELIVSRLRDAIFGLTPAPVAPFHTAAELAQAHRDFRIGGYASLSIRLPRLLRAAHAEGSGPQVLAGIYLLTTRILIKLDEPQLGWLAADRAHRFAIASGDPLSLGESARQLAVLARKAGWHDQALAFALNAADAPALQHEGSRGTALRGLLIQSAAYTLARRGDISGMRELTADAAALAREVRTTHLLDHGGFNVTTVQLHLVSAENSAGDPAAALAAARAVNPTRLPSPERHARLHTDVATAYSHWGRREECLHSLLAAERCAPQETHARPAVQNLVTQLLLTGRTSPDLRGLAVRTGVLEA